MTDAIHNFHPQYSSYTQYSSGDYKFSKFFMRNFAEYYFIMHALRINYAWNIFEAIYLLFNVMNGHFISVLLV